MGDAPGSLLISSVGRDVVRAGLVAVGGGVQRDMWMPWVFRERAVLVKFCRTPFTVIKPPAAPWLSATGICCSYGA